VKSFTWKIFILFLLYHWPVQRIQSFFLSLIKEKNTRKIFCIGNPKTGTRSLLKALKILGYQTPLFFEIPTYWKYGEQHYIERVKKSGYDAFADFPIGHKELYKKIDASLPGSKFILTVRDHESFIRSYSNYFKALPNIQDHLSDRITEMEKRNDDILRYFEKRHSSLLVMNIIDGDGWEVLCEFLNKQIPNRIFPHKNKGKYPS